MNEEYLYWGIGLLAASLLLIVIEVFVPSGGLIALVAAILSLAGITALFQVSVTWGLAGVLMMLVLWPTVFFFGLQVLPSTPVGRRLIFGEGRKRGTAGDEDVPPPSVGENLSALVGAEGEVITDLRPVGTVRIGDRRYDALSEVSLVRAGARVRVVAILDNQIKVRPL